MQLGIWIRRLGRLLLVLILTIPFIYAGKWALQIQTSAERTKGIAKTITSLHAFADQRIRLYQIALAAKPDRSLQQKTEAAFDEYRAEKSRLVISDRLIPHIVSIPEIRTMERQPYSWRVFVPNADSVEVVVMKYEHGNEKLVEDIYSKTLPVGESVIQWLWVDSNERRLKQRGLIGAPRDAGLKLVVNSDEHRFVPPDPKLSLLRADSKTAYDTTNPLFVDDSRVYLAYAHTDDSGPGDYSYGVQLWLRKLANKESAK